MKPNWRRGGQDRGHGQEAGWKTTAALVQGLRPNDQINLTDEDSRIMPVAGGGFEQSYNAQAAVAAGSLWPIAYKHLQDKKLYGLREQTREPVFSIIKSVLGFRQFSLRGLNKVRGEWTVVTMAWNMKRMCVP